MTSGATPGATNSKILSVKNSESENTTPSCLAKALRLSSTASSVVFALIGAGAHGSWPHDRTLLPQPQPPDRPLSLWYSDCRSLTNSPFFSGTPVIGGNILSKKSRPPAIHSSTTLAILLIPPFLICRPKNNTIGYFVNKKARVCPLRKNTGFGYFPGWFLRYNVATI